MLMLPSQAFFLPRPLSLTRLLGCFFLSPVLSRNIASFCSLSWPLCEMGVNEFCYLSPDLSICPSWCYYSSQLYYLFVCLFILFFGITGDWTQGSELRRQVLESCPLLFICFSARASLAFPLASSEHNPPTSASHVADIANMHHCILFLYIYF
jgi:hypothetical protein